MYCHHQEYKPPCSKDIPIDFRVELLKNSSNPPGILGSKGETMLDSHRPGVCTCVHVEGDEY